MGQFLRAWNCRRMRDAREKDLRILKLHTIDEMFEILKDKGRNLAQFKKGDTVHVWNKMKKGYSYTLDEEPGKNFAEGFEPYATPGEILALGAFGGRYLNDCLLEFPAEWFWNAGLLGKLSPGGKNIELNYFKIDSRLDRSEWVRYGWIPGGKKLGGVRAVLSNPEKNPDERGWFQWYCRYWMGRRLPELDSVQIQRWKNFARHHGAIEKNCVKGDVECRPRQRQALLHWAWPFRF